MKLDICLHWTNITLEMSWHESKRPWKSDVSYCKMYTKQRPNRLWFARELRKNTRTNLRELKQILADLILLRNFPFYSFQHFEFLQQNLINCPSKPPFTTRRWLSNGNLVVIKRWSCDLVLFYTWHFDLSCCDCALMADGGNRSCEMKAKNIVFCLN